MSIIKQQLKQFYAKTQPGLTAKELRSALRYDLKAANTAKREFGNAGMDLNLSTAFIWHRTPQGADYWIRRETCSPKAQWDWS